MREGTKLGSATRHCRLVRLVSKSSRSVTSCIPYLACVRFNTTCVYQFTIQAKRTEDVEGYDEQESEAAMDEAIKVWKELKESGMYEGISPFSAGRLLHPLFNACDKHEKYWPTVSERTAGAYSWFACLSC